MELALEPEGVGHSSYFFLPLFIPLVWVSLFTVPNSSPRAYGAAGMLLQRFLLRVDGWIKAFISSGGCARAHLPGVAPEPLEEWWHSFKGFYTLMSL